MNKIGDLFVKDDIVYIVTIITDGYIEKAIPLKDYIERSYIIPINRDNGIELLTIKELVESLMDKFIENKKMK